MAYESRFTWVATHKEIVKYLAKMQDKQTELISILEQAGVEKFNDRDADGSTVRLSEIDPFTFFFYIYKYGPRRLEILQSIALLLDIEKPSGAEGIPTTDARKVWIFPYKIDRINNEIKRLWDFFFSVIEHRITDEGFRDVLDINPTLPLSLVI